MQRDIGNITLFADSQGMTPLKCNIHNILKSNLNVTSQIFNYNYFKT